MTTLRLALRQAAYENRSFRRNPPAAFFTVVFPIMFLVIFNVLFGNDEIEVGSGTTNASTFYVPAIAALSIVSACYTNVAMSVALTRDLGVLKRLRGTPLPPAAYLGGVIIHVTGVALAMVAFVVVVGRVFYDVEIVARTIPAFVLSIVVGAAAFSALGLATTGFIKDSNAAPAVTNAIVLPLLFISDIFITPGTAPEWVSSVADVFPVKHLSQALFAAFNPFEDGSGLRLGDLAVIAAWGVLGVLIALRRFRWEPPR